LDNLRSSVVIVSTATVHAKHLKELLKDNYDLVYGNTHFGAFCAMLGLLKSVPLFFDMHGGKEEISLVNQTDVRWKYSKKIVPFWFDNMVEFIDLQLSSKIICVSKQMIRHLHLNKGIPLGKMIYLTNGVDLQLFKPTHNQHIQELKKQYGIEDKFIFGYIGGYEKWQGVENFAEAARRIPDSNLVFVFVGGEKAAKEGNLLFIPKVLRNQIFDYYALCDVLVLPRPYHTATEIAAPTKFAEYTAMGKPVLTTNVGDAADLVRQYANGIVLADNQIENLIKGILQFRGKSANELNVMGENSRRLALIEFDWNKIIANLYDLMEGMKHH
jgi:glycosyltransferase involved in cell wall biosynthesis